MVCDALENGEQSIILRKGGIHEGRTGFSFEHEQFVFFPTLFHEQVKHLKGHPSPPRCNKQDTEHLPGDRITIKCWAQLKCVWNLTCWETIKKLDPYHIWTIKTVRERFDWSELEDSQPGIKMALLRTYKLKQPWNIQYQKKHGGCRSWLKLEGFEPRLKESSTPVIDDRQYESTLQKLKEIAGSPDDHRES